MGGVQAASESRGFTKHLKGPGRFFLQLNPSKVDPSLSVN